MLHALASAALLLWLLLSQRAHLFFLYFAVHELRRSALGVRCIFCTCRDPYLLRRSALGVCVYTYVDLQLQLYM